MNREQKRALTILISMSLAIVLAIAAVTMKALDVHWLSILLVFFVAAVPCAGVVVFFRLRPDAGTVMFDERDREIQRSAALASSVTAYSLLMVGSFAACFILGERTSIPVTCLPLVVAGAGLCQAYAFFVSLFVRYGRGGDSHE
jgi:archaellum biogenesis protein FlaJ (TadC family)